MIFSGNHHDCNLRCLPIHKKYTRESFQNGLVNLGRQFFNFGLAEALDIVDVVEGMKSGRSGVLKPSNQAWLDL